MPVEHHRGTRHRAGAEGHHVQAPEGVGESSVVAREHFHVGEQVMGEEGWLGALQVRVAGHGRLGVARAEFDQRALHPAQRPANFRDFRAQVQAQVERHLIVARAGGVEFRARRADAGGQCRLDVHVDVFQPWLEDELPRRDLPADLAQTRFDAGAFFFRQQARRRESRRVGDGAVDVVGVQTPVKGNRLPVGAHLRVHGLLETSRPHADRMGGRAGNARGGMRDAGCEL